MKKLILFYLYIFNISDYLVGFMANYDLSYSDRLHPSMIIRSFITLLLLYGYLKNKKSGFKSVNISISIAIIYLLLLHPMTSWIKYGSWGLIYEFSQSFKLILFLLLIDYIMKHKEYFMIRIEKVFIINIVVIILNLYFAYFLKIGNTTMYDDMGFYKGFLAGNDMSVYNISFFTYLLYHYHYHFKFKSLFYLHLFNFYILGTKAFFFTIPASLFYLLHNKKIYTRRYLRILAVFGILIAISGGLFYSQISDIYNSRIGYHFNRQQAKLNYQGKRYDNTILAPIEDLTTGSRLYTAVKQLSFMNQQHIVDTAIGIGSAGQKSNFGTMVKMDLVDIYIKYGIFGFVLIYYVIFVIIRAILKNKSFDFVSVIILLVFTYSTVGGFIMGSATIGTFYALVLGLNYGTIRFPVDRFI
jgi:hypothetical protein